MKVFELSEMTGGWFVGDFEPSVIRTKAFEVGVKHFKAGEVFEPHYHKVAEEITVIVSGRVRINQVEYGAGSIILQQVNEISDFCTLEETTIVAVKMPSAPNDKYMVKEEKSC